MKKAFKKHLLATFLTFIIALPWMSQASIHPQYATDSTLNTQTATCDSDPGAPEEKPVIIKP